MKKYTKAELELIYESRRTALFNYMKEHNITAAVFEDDFDEREFRRYIKETSEEELNDEAWQAKYNAIGDVCAEAVQNMGQDATDATDAVDSVDAAAPVADQSVDAAADVQAAPAAN